MKNGKPSFEEIKEILTKCEKTYEGLLSKFTEDERFYELNFKDDLGMPPQFKRDAVVLPSGRDFVDVFVDNIDISNARVFVNRKGITDISAEDAEMMRKFYLGIIHRTNVENDISPWRVGAKHYALHGLTVLKTVWDADRWPDKPEQKEDEDEKSYAERIDEWRSQTHESLPIVIQAVNPACIMPDPSYGGRQFVFEKHKRIVLDISKRWPHWGNPSGKNVSDEVDFVSYWDTQYRCDFIDGEPILKGGVAKHNYGFIPYVLIDSGLGNLSQDAKPETRYVGILRYIFPMLISESANYSLNNILMKRETMKGGYVTGADAASVAKIKQEYGTYWPIGNKDAQFHDWESKIAPEASYRHLSLTYDYLTAHAAPNVLRGLGEPNIRSAAHERFRASQAAIRYGYSEDAFRHGTEKVLINCAKLQKNIIPENIRVWAKTPRDEFDTVVDKDRMKEPFNCHVEFAPISEEDEYRRHDDIERLVAAGIVTKRWARQQMSNVDALAMEREETRERIRALPGYWQVIDQFLAAQTQASLVELGTPSPEMPPAPSPEMPPEAGRRMATPIPQRAAPGSAEEMQLKLQQLRSQTPMSPTQGQGGGGNR